MAKICIFCGKKAQSKNKEHVIPQWLIKHTNRADKTITINPDLPEFKFMSFTFPACTACNDKYAKLESAVKPIMLDLMDKKAITPEQINLLMDWFDKVRIGLWLGHLYLNKKIDEINPHIFIDNRTGKTDRMLSIEKFKTNPGDQGIAFTGIHTPSFELAPCAWQMIINDYIFTNASSHMLVSGRLGFPYSNKMYTPDNLKCHLNLENGKNRIIKPIIKGWQPTNNSITFYQPIFSSYLDSKTQEKFYSKKYVIDHCLDSANGRGGIFYQKGNSGAVEYLTRPISINVKPQTIIGTRFILPVFDLQDIVTKSYECDSANPVTRIAYEKERQLKLLQNEYFRRLCK